MLSWKFRIFLIFSFVLFVCGIKAATNNNIRAETTEKAYLQLDRNIYIAGENVFFKLYILDGNTNKLSNLSRIAYLVLRNKDNNQLIKARLKVEDGTAFGSISLPDSLSSGPYLLTVFTNWMRNSGEESFFNREIFVANRFDKELLSLGYTGDSSYTGNNNSHPAEIATEINTDKKDYKKREKVAISVNFPQLDSNYLLNASISVFEEVPGIRESVSIINFQKVQAEKKSIDTSIFGKYLFLPESKGEIIRGRVIEKDSHRPVPAACVFLSAIDSVANLNYCYSDSNGVFQFLLSDYYYGKDFALSVRETSINKKVRFELEDKFLIRTLFKPGYHSEVKSLKDYLLKSQDLVTVRKIYQAETALEDNLKSPVIAAIPLIYYKPDYTIHPGEFEALNDFIELSKEIIPPQFKIRKQGEQYKATMADENAGMYLDAEPAIFLDGVLIDNINQIIKLGTDRVKRIEMISKTYCFGELTFPGILSVFTSNGEIRKIQPFGNSSWMQIRKYHSSAFFSNTENMSEATNHLPDFRQLLYWNPQLIFTHKQNSIPVFFCSDHIGNYIIKIEGFALNGSVFSKEVRIKVK